MVWYVYMSFWPHVCCHVYSGLECVGGTICHPCSRATCIADEYMRCFTRWTWLHVHRTVGSSPGRLAVLPLPGVMLSDWLLHGACVLRLCRKNNGTVLQTVSADSGSFSPQYQRLWIMRASSSVTVNSVGL